MRASRDRLKRGGRVPTGGRRRRVRFSCSLNPLPDECAPCARRPCVTLYVATVRPHSRLAGPPRLIDARTNGTDQISETHRHARSHLTDSLNHGDSSNTRLLAVRPSLEPIANSVVWQEPPIQTTAVACLLLNLPPTLTPAPRQHQWSSDPTSPQNSSPSSSWQNPPRARRQPSSSRTPPPPRACTSSQSCSTPPASKKCVARCSPCLSRPSRNPAASYRPATSTPRSTPSSSCSRTRPTSTTSVESLPALSPRAIHLISRIAYGRA